MNKIILYKVLILLIIGAGLIYFGYRFTQSNQKKKICKQNKFADIISNSDSHKFEDVDVTSWQLYQNKQYGFELKYPTNWETDISDMAEEYAIIIFNHKDARSVPEGLKEGSIVLSISGNKERESIESKLKRLKQHKQISVWKKTIDGIHGFYFTGYGEGLEIEHRDYFLALGTGEISYDIGTKRILHGMIKSLNFMK